MDRGRANLGVWLILFGITFLAVNMGWIEGSALVVLGSLWPIILILLGIQVVLGRTRLWIVPPLVAAAFVVFVLGFGSSLPGFGWQPTDSLSFRYNLDTQATAASLFIEVGAVDLVVERGPARTVSGTLRYAGPAPRHSGELRNARYHFELRDQPIRIGTRRPNEWRIQTPPDLPTDLEVKTGAGRVRLDLRGIPVERVVLSGGAGQFEAEFDAVGGHTDVEISTGASDVRVVAPGNIGVRVRFSGGLTSNNLSEAGLTLEDGWYVSPNYSAASRTVDVNVSSGVGRFELVRGQRI